MDSGIDEPWMLWVSKWIVAGAIALWNSLQAWWALARVALDDPAAQSDCVGVRDSVKQGTG